MKASLAPKLFLMVLLVLGMHQAALLAHPDPAKEASSDKAVAETTSLAVPEPSSALLVATLGLMLMLRRRRLHS